MFRAGTYEVAGVIYGDNESGTITEFASRDPPVRASSIQRCSATAGR